MKRLRVLGMLACGLMAATSGGRAWRDGTPIGQVSARRVPNGGIQPQVFVDHRGILHMLYFAGERRAGDLFYTRSTDAGATFSAPTRVNSQASSAIATGTIRGGQLAVAGGRVHVAWNGSESALPRGPANPQTGHAGAPLLYTRSNADGTAFEPQRNVMRASYDLDGGGSLTVDPNRRIYVVWHANGTADAPGEAHRRVWIAQSTDEGATFEAEKPAQADRTGVCGCCGLSALAAPEGLAVLYRSVAAMSKRDTSLLFSRDGARTFHGSPVQEWNISACPMSSMSLAAATGRVLGAWETAGQVYFGRIDTARATLGAAIAAPGEREERKHPRLAAAADGRTLLAWTKGTGWARGGSLAWQVFDADGRPTSATGSAQGVPAWSFGAAAVTKDGRFLLFY
jgi:hypothetical protein